MTLTPAQAQTNPAPSIAGQMDAIVEHYRQIIVLTSGEEQLDEATRLQVKTIAWMLFEQNHGALEDLTAALTSDGRANAPASAEFLDTLEGTRYRDADKLVFRDALEQLGEAPARDVKLTRRVEEDHAALKKIQALYEKEVAQLNGKFKTRAMPVHREAWERYLAFLQQKYTREALLKQYQEMLPAAETRSGLPRKRDQIMGTELPPKTILLTFDDGPHPRYTAQILNFLNQNKLQAVFFEIGKNLGTVNNGEVKLGPLAKISGQILASGNTIGNHSYSHPVLPKLTPEAQAREIDSTNQLLQAVLNGAPVLFRPPYGAESDSVEARAKNDNLKTMIWNIDSMDWADPVPASIEKRVMDEVDKQGRGIILFHDIHNRAIEVLPTLVPALRAKGYTFASWSQTEQAVKTRGTDDAPPPVAFTTPYRESWAVVIGIDKYQLWPQLSYAANDAQGVRDLLVNRYRFKPENVFLLTDGQATRQNILSLLGDKLGNADMVKHDDRVFVFFAGHGATRKLPNGKELGYIIPVDASTANLEGTAISMTSFQDVSDAIPAKHLLFVMDSCYSGLALTRGTAMGASSNYMAEISRREARQMFTAGGADQQVADNGPNGHSVFSWTLLQALDGRADLNGDGIITASELATYVSPAVSALSQQTPAFGNLPGSEGGDFIFDLTHDTEFLDANSSQLSDQGIRLNAELDNLRQQNEQLRQELAAARATTQTPATPAPVATASTAPATGTPPAANTAPQVASAKPVPPSVTPRPVARNAYSLNDEGMRDYKEKNYTAALALFVQAAQMDPTRALFANNAGFACYRLARYGEAAQWYRKSIGIDPARAVAYLNLADTLVELKQVKEARQAYQKYLDLAPNTKSAAYAQQRLEELKDSPR
ncbi:MAG: polysaccharide deacetylase family protein [Acidobacteriota bacterium]|nr:polysaccharide deacetylase family protein [Acidobacteriota bacterium]